MKSFLSYGVMLLAMVVLANCTPVPDEDPSTAWRLEMELGETVEVNLRLTAFVSAIVDDRCPVDVQCPDAGVASATIRLDTRDGSFTYQINNTDRLEETQGNYRVTFILMRPLPDTSVTTPTTKLIRFQIDEL